MQRRGLEETIAGLDDLELTIKTKTDRISEILNAVLLEQESVYNKKSIEIREKIDVFKNKVSESLKELNDLIKPVDGVIEKIEKVNSWKCDNFFNSIDKIRVLQEANPNLLKFIVENFKKDDTKN
jgi:predicted phage tail protein